MAVQAQGIQSCELLLTLPLHLLQFAQAVCGIPKFFKAFQTNRDLQLDPNQSLHCVPRIGIPAFFQWFCQVDRSLSTELNDNTFWLFQVNHVEDIFKSQRLKYNLSETEKSVETVSGFEFIIIAS